MNPFAIILWAICTCIGFLIGGNLKGAVAGLLVGLIISVIAEFIPTGRRRW